MRAVAVFNEDEHTLKCFQLAFPDSVVDSHDYKTTEELRNILRNMKYEYLAFPAANNKEDTVKLCKEINLLAPYSACLVLVNMKQVSQIKYIFKAGCKVLVKPVDRIQLKILFQDQTKVYDRHNDARLL
ncbi:hypothetical protein ACFL54_01290 [Planctomycetota bacterium]